MPTGEEAQNGIVGQAGAAGIEDVDLDLLVGLNWGFFVNYVDVWSFFLVIGNRFDDDNAIAKPKVVDIDIVLFLFGAIAQSEGLGQVGVHPVHGHRDVAPLPTTAALAARVRTIPIGLRDGNDAQSADGLGRAAFGCDAGWRSGQPLAEAEAAAGRRVELGLGIVLGNGAGGDEKGRLQISSRRVVG